MEPAIRVTVTEFARNLSDFINRVAYRRERFVLIRGGEPVAEIGPTPRGVRMGDLPEILGNLPHLTPEEARRFGEDLEEIRAELNREPPRDPWER